MRTIIVIGHKNPDTDSVVSSLVFADFLKKVKKPILGFSGFKVKPARAGFLNKETKLVLDYFKQKPPALVNNLKNKDVILVDHGEFNQSAKGIEQANIVGVLDHHKLGGIKSISPIFYRSEPIGSTSTIIAKMFLENNLSFDKKTAGLLLAAILSDTLKLTLSTTTNEDKEIVKILAKISKEDVNKLAQKIFEAKSDIKDISMGELVSRDYKEYEGGKTSFGIGLCETMYPQKIKEKKEEIFSALKKLKKKRKVKLMFFAIIDILKKNSEVFLLGEKEKSVAEKVFKKKAKGNLLFLSGVASRKKQMLPPIVSFLEKNENVC